MNHTDAPLPRPEITDVQLRFVQNGHDGLVAWASCVLSHTVKLDRIAVRLGRDDRLFLTFPARIAANGERFQLYHPITSQASATLTDAILGRIEALVGPGRATAGDGEAV